MKIPDRRKLGITGAVILGALTALWMIFSAGLIVHKIVGVSHELLERHKELLRFYEEIVK